LDKKNLDDQHLEEMNKFSLAFMKQETEEVKKEGEICHNLPWYKVVYSASVEDVVRL